MESLNLLKVRFAAMPRILRLVALASIVIGAGVTVLPVIPGSRFQLGPHELSWEQLWQTRVALALFVGGPLMVLVGVSIFFRSRWARPLVVVMPALQVLPFLGVHLMYGAPDPVASAPAFAAMSAIWVLLAMVYLYGTRGPREYFANTT
jgi:hypothetical protein